MASDYFSGVAGQNAWRLRLAIGETGAMGLCLFFTLSAYLITTLLVRERETNGLVSVRRFYIRRVLRIWPLYFSGVAIGIGIALILNRANDAMAFVWYLLFAGNFYCGAFGWLHNPMTALWSISIEEQFYLVWPWAMRWFSRRGLMVCALLLIAAANIALFSMGRRHVETESKVWTNTLVQFEMFATGILLALVRKHVWRNSFIGLMLVLAGPILWFVACFVFHAKQPAGAGTAISGAALMAAYALIALGCGSVLQGFCIIGPARIPAWLAGLGKVSYGLYVYHVLSIDFAYALFASFRGPLYTMVSAFLAFLLTVAAAIVSYQYLEAPFLRLKRRFEILHSKPI